MNRNWTLAAAFTFVVGLMIWLAAGRPCPTGRSSAADTPPPAASSAAVAPGDLTLQDLDGNIVRMSDLQGKAVVLNFWATWCPPCRAEIPDFIDLQKKYGPQGLQIVGIAMDNSGPAVVAQFVKQNAINYPVAMPNDEVTRRYGSIDSLPTTYYIGRDGRVVQSVTGLIPREDMEANVKTALATRVAAVPVPAGGSGKAATF